MVKIGASSYNISVTSHSLGVLRGGSSFFFSEPGDDIWKTILFKYCKFLCLVAQPLNPPPPHRAIGYSYTYRAYVFQALQGIALYPLKFALSQPRGGDGRGYRSSSCPLEGMALYGGIAEIAPIPVDGSISSCISTKPQQQRDEAFENPSGPKKPWQPQTWQDLTRFSPLDFSLLSPDFRGLVLLNCT